MKKKAAISGIILSVLAITILVVLWIDLENQNDSEKWLKGSYRTEKNGWVFIHLEGSPYQIGFQHGYWLADHLNNSLSGLIHVHWSGTTFGDWWDIARGIAKEYIWSMVPEEYKEEISGIVAGLQTVGYTYWDQWDIIAFNAWADLDVYWGSYLRNGNTQIEQIKSLAHRASHEVSCSAFIATGNATKNGEIIIAHNTWAGYAGADWNVIFHLKPQHGNELLYQSSSGVIWSSLDWIMNSAGLMACETTIPEMDTYNINGTPIFVRERTAMQYTDNIDEWLAEMTTNGNGAYANEWLIGDAKTREICSLQLGCYYWDVYRTFNGFIGSSNYPKGEGVRLETKYDWTTPTTSGYCRYERWKQLNAEYNGLIDVELAKIMIADHYDVYLEVNAPSVRTICGHGEVSPESGYRPSGALDGKVTSSSLVRENLGMWGRWGHPCGIPFIANEFLMEHPQYKKQLPYLPDLNTNDWTLITAKGPKD